jgi:hypothetical protein
MVGHSVKISLNILSTGLFKRNQIQFIWIQRWIFQVYIYETRLSDCFTWIYRWIQVDLQFKVGTSLYMQIYKDGPDSGYSAGYFSSVHI